MATVTRLRVRGVRVRVDKDAVAAMGDLRVEDLAHSAFGRPMRVAHLTHPERPQSVPELLPPLFDVKLLKLDKEAMVLAGIERESVDGKLVDYAQTWLARFTT